jgi:hypothetical protein
MGLRGTTIVPISRVGAQEATFLPISRWAPEATSGLVIPKVLVAHKTTADNNFLDALKTPYDDNSMLSHKTTGFYNGSGTTC